MLGDESGFLEVMPPHYGMCSSTPGLRDSISSTAFSGLLHPIVLLPV